MRVNRIKKYLHSYENQENAQRMEETIAECRRITRNNTLLSNPQSGFWEFLSEVFRMNGKVIFGGQLVTLIMVCLIIQGVNDYPKFIPVFIPFFILASLPVLFRAQIYHMSEIELVTKNSYAQLLLARLIIIGAADIVCFTLLLAVEILCFRSGLGVFNLILYVFVPYMICVTAMLRLIRSGKRSIISSAVMSMIASFIWGITALAVPSLYVGSSVGLWMICFITFGIFFIREVGYLPQDFGYYPSYTAKDYLEHIAVLKGIPRRAAAIKIKELLDEVGLSDVSRKKIRTFSGGMKQRLGIAQALLNDPRILILDEPTAGLDPKERVRFRNLLSSLARDRIVILSTHIVSDIEAIADRVFVMKRGQFVSQGSIRELLTEVQGHVWELAIDPAETEKWEEETTVANLRREDHQTILRVISEESPGAGAVQIQATLEDLYLYYFPTERS